jgi:hypothetical protein
MYGSGQCCGSETFISDPASDPANSEFRIRILDSNPDRIRTKVSDPYGSGSATLDPEPAPRLFHKDVERTEIMLAK